ncbi:MAG: ABC transporter ATP-binding protein [Acidimicrobiales bacterium]
MTEDLSLDAQSVHVEYAGDFRVPAVSGLDVQMSRGEWRGMLGESGSGKSTFGMALLGLLSDARVTGSARLGGSELLTLDEGQWEKVRWRGVALAFQATTSLNPALRVDLQVGEPIAVHFGVSKREAQRRAGALLDRVGLARDKHRSYPAEMSTGQKRLVILAAALACDPELLVLDEPTAGLDPLTRAHVLGLLNELRAERPTMSVLMMGHDIDALIATEIDIVQVLYMGACVELGPRTAVLGDPSHPYTRGLLNANPTLRTVKDLRAIRGSSPDAGTSIRGCSFVSRCTQALPECGESTPQLAPVSHASLEGAAGSGGAQPDTRQRAVTQHVVACIRGGIVTVLEARGVCQSYQHGLVTRVSVLDNVNLVLRSGEVLGLVGMTGAGKTTLGLGLAGLLRVDKGQVLVDGSELSSLHGVARADAHRQVQMVFQDPYESVSARFTVEEAVREPLDIAGAGSMTERLERVRATLEQVNLSPTPALLHRRAHMLSGGQLQRVVLARALIVDPKVLLADEPVALLDPSEQARVLQLLKQLQVERGLAMVFISHSLPLVMRVADRIAVLAHGNIVELATGEELLSGPRSPQAAALLKAAGWVFGTQPAVDLPDPSALPRPSGANDSHAGRPGGSQPDHGGLCGRASRPTY